MSYGDENFFARDCFSSGCLPTKREVIEMLVWHLLPKGKGFTCPPKEEAASCVADVLIEHWIWCNLYPKHKKNVVGAILKLYDEFKPFLCKRVLTSRHRTSSTSRSRRNYMG